VLLADHRAAFQYKGAPTMALLKSALACLGTAAMALGLAFFAAQSPRARAAASSKLAPVFEPLAQSGSYGEIKGKLVWGGANPPAPQKIANVNKDPQVCAVKPLYKQDMVVNAKTKGIQFALAYIANPKGKNADLEKATIKDHPKVEMDQKNCEFIPHVMGMMKDQEIVFKSSDPVGHNVRYQGFSNGAKNVTIPANGQLSAKLVKEIRPMTVNCDIHTWMSAYLMVFDHPFFAVTDDQGNFTIKGVPAGQQNLVIWHERVGYVTPGAGKGMPVTVKANETTDVGEIKLDPTKVKS
jgi:hypothetical protein